MRNHLYPVKPVLLVLLLANLLVFAVPASAETAAEIDKEVELSLKKLYDISPAAVKLSQVSKGILVFPSVIKAGLIVGAQYGKGLWSSGRRRLVTTTQFRHRTAFRPALNPSAMPCF